MRADDDLVDEAQQAILNHSWVEHMPVLTVGQLAELLPLLEVVLRPKRRLPSVPKEYRKANPPKVKVDKGSQSQGRTRVYARSGGRCETGCGSRGQEWHHRKARSLGGRWDASNGMHVCRPCHAWIGEHAIEAGGNGWYLGAREDPATAPMLRFGVRVYVDDAGGVSAVDEGAA